MSAQSNWNLIFERQAESKQEFTKHMEMNVNSFSVNFKGLGTLNGDWHRVDLAGDTLFIDTKGNYKAAGNFWIAKGNMEITSTL